MLQWLQAIKLRHQVQVGKIECLERATYETVKLEHIDLDREMNNQASISHTRWATHGGCMPVRGPA